MNRCQRICLTPTRNESWIIQPFVAAARQWADHVIVADQGSTDGTFQQLQTMERVKPVINDSPKYDEGYRQKLLLRHAREFDGKRILLGLDADEALSANFATSAEWAKLSEAAPGSVIRLRWVNVLPGFKEAWIPPTPTPFGFIDDGSEHQGTTIHSPRTPQPPGAPIIDLHEVVVLHFQYTVWERMARKHRWYQAWELLNHPQKGPLQIFRHYNHMHGSWNKEEIHPLQPEWIEGYDKAGVDFRSLACEPITWWDREMVQMLIDHGPAKFRKLNVWNEDWNAMADRLGVKHGDLSDPRNGWEKLAHRLLTKTQSNRGNFGVRLLERWLRIRGW